MSGNATRKLNEATEAFMGDLVSARETMMRIAQIQAKMSQTMDECLAEFREMFPNAGHRHEQNAEHSAHGQPIYGVDELNRGQITPEQTTQITNGLPKYMVKAHRNNGD